MLLIDDIGHVVIQFRHIKFEQANERPTEGIGFPITFFCPGDDFEKSIHPLLHQVRQQRKDAHHQLEFLRGMIDVMRSLERSKQLINNFRLNALFNVFGRIDIEHTLLNQRRDALLENTALPLFTTIECRSRLQNKQQFFFDFAQHFANPLIISFCARRFTFGFIRRFCRCALGIKDCLERLSHPFSGMALKRFVTAQNQATKLVQIPRRRTTTKVFFDDRGKRLLIKWGVGRLCSRRSLTLTALQF